MLKALARAGSVGSPHTSKSFCPNYIYFLLILHRERFATVLANYQTTRAQGGTFILLIHDLWGTDGTQASTAPYPGDDGDWSSWDNYLTQLFSDIDANGMTTNLVVDIWNEPDLGTVFWGRTQAQYLQMWGRTYYRWR